MVTVRFVVLLILAIITTNSVCAQQNIIRGVVSDEYTDQVLDRATVLVQLLPEKQETRGLVTDQNGFFQVGGLTAGEYYIEVRYIGFQTYQDTILVAEEPRIASMNILLKPLSEELGEVTVAERSGRYGAGRMSIHPEFFNRTPTPGGNADLVGYLQSQPGVLATGDRGGQLFVRGGMPSENMILMDGSLIYQPFHILGFFSVFPEDVVASADFYPGGFGPRYSGRASAVMDVRLKNADLYATKWNASASPFIAGITVETPLAIGKSALLISMKSSMIEQTSAWYLQEQQPLTFNSQLVKFNSSSNTGVACSAHAMRTYDRGKLDFESSQYFKWSNIVTGGRCAGVSESSLLSFMEVNFGLSYYSNETGGENQATRSSNIYKSNLDLSFTQYIRDLRVDYGFFTNYSTTNYNLRNRFVSLNEKEETLLTTGGYLSLNIPIGRYLHLDPGVVYTNYFQRISSSVEPRFRFSFQVPGETSPEIYGAAGMYHQGVVGLSDFRDAGTAFTAWMLPPDPDRSLKTVHYLLGLRFSAFRFLEASVEGYYKEIKDSPVSVWSTMATSTTDIAYANGTVHGFDVRLNYDQRNFYAGLGYGYSIVEYTTAQDHFMLWFGEPIQNYHPAHDRRHQVNASTGVEFGNFSLNINWSYGSGMPFTRPVGFDSYFSFENGPPDVTDEYGTPRILLNKPFDGRMPDFHRLDISLEQKFQMILFDMSIQAGAMNMYSQKNLFYYDVYFQRGISQLPFVPFIALKLQSK